MRSSLVVLVGIAGAVSLAAALPACSLTCDGNSCTAKTVPEFVDSSQPQKTAAADWAGEEIVIENDGVNPLTGLGGIEILVDQTAARVAASAVFAARADVEADAKLSIADAIQTLQVTGGSGNSFNVKCGHGNARGTSGVAASGCKLLRVTIPGGSDAQPVRLKVGSGNGDIKFAGSGTLIASNLVVDSNGSGDVQVKVRPVKDASIVITSEFGATVALPSNFSSQSVVLTVDTTDPNEIASRINTSAFSGLVTNQPYPTTGATADAAKVINITAKGLLDGTLTLQSF